MGRLQLSKVVHRRSTIVRELSTSFSKGSLIVPTKGAGDNCSGTSGVLLPRRFSTILACTRGEQASLRKTVCHKGTRTLPCRVNARGNYTCYPCQSVYKFSRRVRKCRCQGLRGLPGRVMVRGVVTGLRRRGRA